MKKPSINALKSTPQFSEKIESSCVPNYRDVTRTAIGAKHL